MRLGIEPLHGNGPYPVLPQPVQPVEGGGGQDSFELDRRLATEAGSFFLTVVDGEGMASAGIHPGDMLLVEPVTEDEVEDGDIVVARLDGECLLQRYVERGGERVLEPADPDYLPILLRERDCVFVGRVAAIFRRLRFAQAAVTAAAGEEGVSRSRFPT